MLYGSFEAIIKGKKVTGDYPTKKKPTRLSLLLPNGHLDMYNCSLKFIELPNALDIYDFAFSIMSPLFDPKKALETMKNHSNRQIGDVLLDQTIFAGVGNIIKNEVLFRANTLPDRMLKDLSPTQQKQIIQITQEYVVQFYEWRKRFELKKHYQIYRQSTCPTCSTKVTRKRTGEYKRISFFCTSCQH